MWAKSISGDMEQAKIQICPSIIAGDMANIASEVKKVEDSGADALHIDVMDGQFVPNLTIGPQVVAAIKRNTTLFLDVHMMVYSPIDYIEKMAASGADRITIHFEATEDMGDTLNFIKKCNMEVGLAFSPDTSITFATKYLDICDLFLIMTVHPGFCGQEFISDCVDKIKDLKFLIDQAKAKSIIQVDGGINEKTLPICYEAGARSFVMGSHLFNAASMKAEIENMHKAFR